MAGKELLPVTVLDAPVVLAKSPGGLSFKSDGDACQKIPIKPAPAPKGDLCGVSEWANTVTFHPKHPKLDQNLPFTPQSETSIPSLLCGSRSWGQKSIIMMRDCNSVAISLSYKVPVLKT